MIHIFAADTLRAEFAMRPQAAAQREKLLRWQRHQDRRSERRVEAPDEAADLAGAAMLIR